MKPGIPWSVKGIEQQARAAAKQAARQSGMTIGEWLNSVILESAEGGDDLERRYRRPPYRPKPVPGAEQGEGEEVTLRLEEIAEQLHTIARHESETALSRHMTPEDEDRLRAIVERLDAHEQHTTTTLGAMQERLEEISHRLGRDPENKLAQRADEVPGYRALEGALRHIIEHIEVSETRTRDSIRSLHERLAETLEHTGSEPASVGQLEQRVAELAERMGRADAQAPNDLAEVRETEQRLRSLVEEARQASGSIDPSQDVSRLQGEIDSLNQRFGDMMAEAVSQHDIDQLRLEIEQLAATVSQGSGHAIADLGGRVEQLEAELKRQLAERDQATQRDVAALGERIAATEKRLEHLATIEDSVAQLARSLKTGGADAGQGDGASPELKALEDGLKAVRASAEIADRRTQETLQAVHETLEHIVGKLAELEADDEPDGEAANEARSEEFAKEPAEEETSSLAAEPGSAEAPAEVEAADAKAMDTGAEGFVFPGEPTTEDSEPESRDGPQMQAPDGPASDADAPAQPVEPPVREDYIAAARRAAQMAATRNQNPVTSGFNKFSQRMSGAGRRPDGSGDGRVQKPGFVSSLLAGLRGRKTKPGNDGKPDSKKTKRKRLIFAGLVLLAAVSAYGAQRDLDSITGFDVLGGALPGSSGDLAGSATPIAPQAGEGMPAASPYDGLATASIAPPGRAAVEDSATVSDMLPAEIGPESLRQAAVRGDAIAQFVVAGRYLDGKAVARDEEQAAQWYARAASQGLAAAQYRLGSMYEHGRGRPLDRAEAKAWYEQAAASGNINAMHNLAVLHTDAGSGSRDYRMAASWFRKAAERGLKDSQFNLAVLNEQGLGMPRSPENAVFWYSLAAVQGDREAAAKAKALEASLAPETAKQVHARLLAWRALPADRKANVVPVAESSWQETS
jgi:localization factor PodJL